MTVLSLRSVVTISLVRVPSDHLLTLDASATASLSTRSEERCGSYWDRIQRFVDSNGPRHQDDGEGRRSFGPRA